MSLDMHMRLYHTDISTDYLEICPDLDGLGMVEIRQEPSGDKILIDLTNVDDMITALQTVRNHMSGK